MTRYIVNHKLKKCAAIFGGDEHGWVKMPEGWEDLPAGSSKTWSLSLSERLIANCPKGYSPIFSAHGKEEWVRLDELPKTPDQGFRGWSVWMTLALIGGLIYAVFQIWKPSH